LPADGQIRGPRPPRPPSLGIRQLELQLGLHQEQELALELELELAVELELELDLEYGLNHTRLDTGPNYIYPRQGGAYIVILKR
jgi:hypothetical protein